MTDIIVRGPNGSVRFPAGTPRETIDRVMREQVAGSSKPAAGKTAPPTLGQSLFGGFVSGSTANFQDELGATANAAFKNADFNSELERIRQQGEEEQRANPLGYLAGQVGGIAATLPLQPGLRIFRAAAPVAKPAISAGARLAERLLPRAADVGNSAATAALYSALFGAGSGTDWQSRLQNAGLGALAGGGLGAAAPFVTKSITALARGAGNAAARGINALMPRAVKYPEKQAAGRVQAALQADTNRRNPLTWAGQEVQQAQAGGTPMIVADTGGEWTRALLRSATNTSPAGRDIANLAVQGRFENQSGRAVDFTKRLFGVSGDNGMRVEALQRSAAAANAPAYRRAYAAGAGGIWTQDLANLTISPFVQRAMSGAVSRGKNEAAAMGQPWRPTPNNPFVMGRDGRLRPKTNLDGSRGIPTLQYWDSVQRNLRQQYEVAVRRGAKEDARQIGLLRDALLGELDRAVPEFRQARAGAAAFFGANDALEAGQMMARDLRMPNQELARSFARMTRPEQELFREGMANELTQQFGRNADNRNIANQSWFSNPAARERLNIVFGPKQAAQMEAFGRMENLMNRTKQAVQGNSSTMRQFMEMGLAGGITAGAGIGGAALGGWNPMNPTAISPTAMLGALLAIGARRGFARLDERVSREVARLLASDDPQQIARAAQLVAANPSAMIALRNADDMIAKATAPVAQGLRGPMLAIGRAGEPGEDQRQNQ